MNNEAKKMLEEMIKWEPEVKESYEQFKKASVEIRDNTDVIESIFKFLNDIKKTQSREMYPAFKTNVQTEIKELHNALSAIKNTNFEFETRDEVKRHWQNTIENLRNAFQNLFEVYADYINYLKLRDLNDQDLYHSLVAQQEEMQQTVNEIDNLKEGARRALEEIGMTKFAELYEDKARKHSIFSALWLAFTIVLGLTSMAGVVLLFYRNPVEGSVLNLNLNAQNLILRVFLLSIPVTALVWFARNYRSHRHLQEVNEHTQNALMSFKTFIRSTEDEDTKDDVLMSAAETVFSQPDTGYASNGDGTDQNPLKEGVQDMIREDESTG